MGDAEVNTPYLQSLIATGKPAFLRGAALAQALPKFGKVSVRVLSTDGNTATVEVQTTNGPNQGPIQLADLVGVVLEKRLEPSASFARYLVSRVGKLVALRNDALRVAAHFGARSFARLVEVHPNEQMAQIELVGQDISGRDRSVMVTIDTIEDLSALSKTRIVPSHVDASGATGALSIQDIEKRVCKLACEAMGAMATTGPASEYTGASAIEAGFCRSCAPSGNLPDESTWRAAVADAIAVVTRIKGDKDARFVRFSCPAEVEQEDNPFQLSDTQCHAFLLLIVSDKGANKYYMTSAGLPLFVKGAIAQLAMPESSAWKNPATYAAVEWGDMPGWASALGYFTNLHFICKRIDDSAVRNLLDAAFSRGYVQTTGNLHIQPSGMRTGGAACKETSGDMASI